MREWQVGDPVGDGNDIGVPDTKYMGYLRKDDKNNQSNSFIKDIERSKQYQDEAWKLYEEDKFYDALYPLLMLLLDIILMMIEVGTSKA